MTFKEKLKKEKPGLIDDRYTGGCKGCPHGYGYEEEKPCKGINDEECTKCWNREMPNTPVPMTAEEAWDIGLRVIKMSFAERNMILGTNDSCNGFIKIFENFTPQEAKAKIDEWESKQIHVGDVVSHQGLKGVVTRVEQEFVQVLTHFGTAPHYDDIAIKRLVKTGKHIDIQTILEQIGKEE